MTKYREIIRLTSLGFSQRNIMASCGVAQKTVVKVQKRARELNLVWPLEETMTDIELQKLLFQKEDKVSSSKRMKWMDYELTRQELEEADALCHGNWIEIQQLYKRIDKLESLLTEAGIDLPDSY